MTELFYDSYEPVLIVVGCNCGAPTVDVQLQRRFSRSDIMTTDGPFTLKALVTTNCSESNQTRFEWKFSKIDRKTNHFSPFLVYGPIDRDTIRLWPGLFGAVVVYAAVEVSVSGNAAETSAYGFGFVTIHMPALIAKIVGPASVTRTIGNVTLDGSLSYDPGVSRWIQHRRLNFLWYCQRTCHWDTEDALYFPIAKMEPCFGIANATDDVFSNQRLVFIDAASLKSNCTYLFQLAVKKDSRTSYAKHELRIKPAVPFYVR